MKIKFMKTIVLLALCFVLPSLCQAQELPPENIVDTPFDSWLLVLVGAGALYGVIKMWNSNPSAK